MKAAAASNNNKNTHKINTIICMFLFPFSFLCVFSLFIFYIRYVIVCVIDCRRKKREKGNYIIVVTCVK